MTLRTLGTNVASLNNAYIRGLHVYADSTHGIGSGDDTAFIQAKLDQINPALGLDTVIIHSGTWMVDAVNETMTGFDQYKGGGIQPKTGTTLLLAPDAILKTIPNPYPGSTVIDVDNTKSNITIRGGQILGDRATHDYTTQTAKPTHEWGFGIALRGCTDVHIEGVKITGCTGDGIAMLSVGLIGDAGGYYDCKRIVVKDCTIDGSRRNNISVTASDQVLIEGCTITNAGTNDGVHDGTAPRYGIDIEGYGVGSVDYEIPYRVTVRGNKFVGNTGGAIMNFDGYQTLITGNWSNGNISFGYGTETTITNNTLVNLADTTNPAVSSNGSGTYAAHSVVSDNIIRGFGTGVKVQRDNVLVADNTITNFQTTGIDVFTCTQVTVQNNKIYDGTATTATGIKITTATYVRALINEITNTAVGLAVAGTSTDVSLRNNAVIKGNQGITIAAGCAATVKGNTTNLPGHAAGQSYDITWAGTSVVTCEENTFRNSSTYSINATNATGGLSRIVGNKILDSLGSTPINCSGGAHALVGNVIVGARTSGGSTPAINLGGSATGSKVVANVCYHIGTVAFSRLVDSSSASGTTIVGNSFGGTTVATTGSGDFVGGNLPIGSTPPNTLADTALLSRSNHTGTQASSTISDFNTAVNALISAYVGGTPAAKANQFVRSGYNVGIGGGTTMTVTASTMYLRPIRISKGGTVTSIKVNVTTLAAGATLRLGLYAHDATTGLPGALIADYGTVDASTTGSKSITISQALSDETVYWAAVAAQGGSPSASASDETDQLLPMSSTASNVTAALFVNSVSGALPAGPPTIGGTGIRMPNVSMAA